MITCREEGGGGFENSEIEITGVGCGRPRFPRQRKGEKRREGRRKKHHVARPRAASASHRVQAHEDITDGLTEGDDEVVRSRRGVRWWMLWRRRRLGRNGIAVGRKEIK